MKMFRALVGFLLSLTLSFIMGATVSHIAESQYQMEIPVAVVAIPLFVLGVALEVGMLDRETGMAYAIQQEFWVKYILDNLFKSNPHLLLGDKDDQYVINGSVVHIPVAGAKPAVVKNRSSYPGTAVRRTDTEITYALDVYSTDPIHIPKAELLEVSYDKLGSVLGEHTASLAEIIGDDVLIKWATNISAGNVLRTTGADASDALAPSATGTRKMLTKDDLRKAMAAMDRNNVPRADRYAVIPSDMYQQLLQDSTLLGRDGIFGGEADITKGVVGNLYGFKLIPRSAVTVYTAVPALKALGAAGAATDNMAAICFQKNAVTTAQGTIEMFENIKDALYYGDIYSAQVKMGARLKRAEGVVAIVQVA